MRVIFKDTEKQTELTLPITPPSYRVGRGTSMEIVHIHTLGDVSLPGNISLEQFRLDCLLPAHPYPFCTAEPLDPYEYVASFRTWCREKTVLRYIVSDTPVNVMVRVEYLEYGEDDGTGDVKLSLTLREYKALKVAVIEKPEEPVIQEPPPQVREPEVAAVIEQIHTVVSGDTLWAICRRYYGNPLLYSKVAAYNGVANPNLIYVGNVLRIPPEHLL